MRDTPSAVDALLGAMLQARTLGERVRMETGMFGSAKRLALAGLRYEQPLRDPVAERVALLERLYGDDLPPALRASVAAYVTHRL